MPVERLVALTVLTVLAIGVALVLQRRRPDPPSAPSYRAPAQLDRDDFSDPTSGTLVVVFSSSTCDTCPVVWAAVERIVAGLDLPAGQLVSQRIDVQDQPTLHRRYKIDGVPTTVVADADGVVVQAFFGPVAPEELAAAISAVDGG